LVATLCFSGLATRCLFSLASSNRRDARLEISLLLLVLPVGRVTSAGGLRASQQSGQRCGKCQSRSAAHKFQDDKDMEVSMSFYGHKETEVRFEETVDAIHETTDHSVYYVTLLDASKNQGNPLKRSFIAGRFWMRSELH
jgi:hypothetical protein